MKQSEEDREKSKKERRRKLEKLYANRDHKKFAIMLRYSYSARRLQKFGLQNFDERGRVEVHDIENKHIIGHMSGDKFLIDMIKYFESVDGAYYYKKCAQVKNLLDEYNRKFQSKVF